MMTAPPIHHAFKAFCLTRLSRSYSDEKFPAIADVAIAAARTLAEKVKEGYAQPFMSDVAEFTRISDDCRALAEITSVIKMATREKVENLTKTGEELAACANQLANEFAFDHAPATEQLVERLLPAAPAPQRQVRKPGHINAKDDKHRHPVHHVARFIDVIVDHIENYRAKEARDMFDEIRLGPDNYLDSEMYPDRSMRLLEFELLLDKYTDQALDIYRSLPVSDTGHRTALRKCVTSADFSPTDDILETLGELASFVHMASSLRSSLCLEDVEDDDDEIIDDLLNMRGLDHDPDWSKLRGPDIVFEDDHMNGNYSGHLAMSSAARLFAL